MKRFISLLLAALTLPLCLPVGIGAADPGMKDSGINYAESTVMLKNPHMGYPTHVSMTLREAGNLARNDTGIRGDRALDLQFLAKQSEHAVYGGEYGSAYSSQYLPNDASIRKTA